MTNPADLFQQAAAHTRAAVAGVKDSQLGDETPCSDWSVEELLNHIIGGATMGATVFGGDAPEGADPVSAYDNALAGAVAAMHADGALDGNIATPGGGEMPGGAFATILAMDNLIHGWDLAKATGQSTELPADLVDIIYAGFEPQMNKLRQGDSFGPDVPQPEDARAQDKLIGMMGRKP